MKIILTSRIKTLGNVGDIKVVADGYGKNYLLPNNYAIIYSDKNYKAFEEKKKQIEEEDRKNREFAESIKSKIEKKEMILIESAGDNDRLYGSISSLKIVNFVNELLKEKALKKTNVIIKDPIKTLGKFSIVFDLHPEVSLTKDIIVARSKEEAEKIKKGEFSKKDGKKEEKGQEENKENTKEEK